MAVHKYGDKLDGSILSDNAWKKIKDSVETTEKPFTIEIKRNILNKFKTLAKEFCIGENEHKCLLCGDTQNRADGLCNVCYKAFFDRGVLRQCGTVHSCTQKDVLCSCCGENLGFSMGVCRRCYYMMKRFNLKDIPELKEFLRKKKGQITEAEKLALPLTQVR